MSFWECFHSGYRFRLPVGTFEAWPENFYWIKNDEKSIRTIHLFSKSQYSGSRHELVKLNENDPEEDFDYNYTERTDWYLHPEDEYKYQFSKKMKEIVNV